MLTEVTDQQKKSYAEKGFLVVENFLNPAELDEWRAAVDHAVAERGQQMLSFATTAEENAAATRSEEEKEYYDQVFTQRNNLWQTDEHMRRLLLQPGLGSS